MWRESLLQTNDFELRPEVSVSSLEENCRQGSSKSVGHKHGGALQGDSLGETAEEKDAGSRGRQRGPETRSCRYFLSIWGLIQTAVEDLWCKDPPCLPASCFHPQNPGQAVSEGWPDVLSSEWHLWALVGTFDLVPPIPSPSEPRHQDRM